MEMVKIITLPKCRIVTSGLEGDQKKFNKMW